MKERAAALLLDLARHLGGSGVIVNEHTLDASETRRHVDLLGRRFDFIEPGELSARLRRPGPRPFCLLTFDDGKRSNFTRTAPELHRLGVPAAFYVVTDFLTTGEPLWFDTYAALRRALPEPPRGLEPDTVKMLPHRIRMERIRRAAERHGIAPPSGEDVAPMTWEQARGLVGMGFTVGAHGRRHAVLTREPERAARAEIRDSLGEVSRRTGVPCTSFSFPNGNYNARLARYARECGARTVMTTEPCWVSPACEPWRLPRVQLHPGQSKARLELKLAAAATGAVLRDPDGSGRAYRRVWREDRRRRREGADRYAGSRSRPARSRP